MRAKYLRESTIGRLSERLQATGFPRLQMLLLVALTGGAGFLASAFLLHRGVERMLLRYPLAIALAYGVFLILLWLWLRTSADDYTDVPDLPDISVPGHGAHGGGWDGEGGNAVSDAMDAAAGADEFAIPLLVLLAVGVLLVSSLWVVYSAPALFAELLIDGALSASLYRRLRGIERQHWLTTAMRRTWWSFAVAAVVAGGVGMALQSAYPAAHTLGEVVYAHKHKP